MTWQTTQRRYLATGRVVPAAHLLVRGGSVELRAGPESAGLLSFEDWGEPETFEAGNHAVSVGPFAVLITPLGGAEYIFSRDHHNV